MAAVMSHSANKRKRDTADVPNMRTAPGLSADSSDFANQYLNDDATEAADSHIDLAAVLGQDNSHRSGQSASDTASAALAHAQYHTMTVPQPTEQTFLSQTEAEDRQAASEAQMGQNSAYGNDIDFAAAQANGDGSSAAHLLPQQQGQAQGDKPGVGSDAWHKIRRDNHKEVERRRRETINEGINELAKIVPGAEKNKGSILQRAVQFITQLKENEDANIEKWSLEKMLTEQAITELSSTVDRLKSQLSQAHYVIEQYKQATQKAGVEVDVKDKPANDI